MRVISKRRLDEFGAAHPNARKPLERWRQVVKAAEWESFHDVRDTFGRSVDGGIKVQSGRNVEVFDAGGNNYRIVTAIHYNTGIVYVLLVMTHEEYSKMDWKDTL